MTLGINPTNWIQHETKKIQLTDSTVATSKKYKGSDAIADGFVLAQETKE
jgi:hypothetical protein